MALKSDWIAWCVRHADFFFFCSSRKKCALIDPELFAEEQPRRRGPPLPPLSLISDSEFCDFFPRFLFPSFCVFFLRFRFFFPQRSV